ncbi:MAG TPA: ABC transporter permease [Flavobacteriales bacterium]|jgi:putative ABC transport system permease protein|nr:ABC transporter permease [Flavobacteriales bacterium]
MLLKISWLNIWRKKSRSLVVIGSIAVGIAALIAGTGLMNGFLVSYMASIIQHETSDFQVHHPDFKLDYEVEYVINEADEKLKYLSNDPSVIAVSSRVISNGMVASAQKAKGVQIRGINPKEEALVTRLDSALVDGAYFEGIKRNPIIIGYKMAEELKVKVRSKIVLTFTDNNGEIVSAAFRVVGIARSSSVKLNELFAFVRKSDLQPLLGVSGIHEIAVMTTDRFEVEKVSDSYSAKFLEDKVETWSELAPELAMMQEMYGYMLYILMAIIMLALVFGIVNTMLMAVLERFRELGMLMALGMNKARVFAMIVLETLLLSFVGAPIGLLLGWATIAHFQYHGLDLSAYSQGLESFGYTNMLYPYLENKAYAIVTGGVIFTALLGALYPAWKAVKLNPVEALHKI